ncbi:hypothetical protein TTHERM_00763050 (macronuclear) [Tetrahymena thermophila SB210]|uniref:Uncharacterized protein n=1 Tax=Tetrahymena thermophila (strain SB210) TaxID=312017 RepID=I7MAQ8_TETTS|nr:hypothetical protein TTHERM_00763050 [Tetrahymena thermophila SB210]EAS05118.3 hypothetical protein TTHERM_00763050 [Tetrahymena thermophila SB210]|eukprot:XP_001025363.3 hypothetical protein TTHERM_00763050 [Tetrahymena thermophila SB210]
MSSLVSNNIAKILFQRSHSFEQNQQQPEIQQKENTISSLQKHVDQPIQKIMERQSSKMLQKKSSFQPTD